MALDELSQSLGRSEKELKGLLDQARRKLLEARQERVKPPLDDKVLTAWNGMMLTSFAEAAFVLNDSKFLDIAVKNAEFLASAILVEGRVLRSWRQGRAHLNGYLEDYALVIEGWLATYQVSREVRWLDHASRLMERQFEFFQDEEGNDFYFTSSDHEKLLIRQKEYLDNATPAGNGVTCLNLLRLSVLLGKKEYRDLAQSMLHRVSGGLAQFPSAFGYWLQAFDFLLGPAQEIAVVGKSSEWEALLQPVREKFLPHRVLAFLEKHDSELVRRIPLLEGKTAIDDQATVYVCRNYTCQEPVTTAQELERVLDTTVEGSEPPG